MYFLRVLASNFRARYIYPSGIRVFRHQKNFHWNPKFLRTLGDIVAVWSALDVMLVSLLVHIYYSDRNKCENDLFLITDKKGSLTKYPKTFRKRITFVEEKVRKPSFKLPSKIQQDLLRIITQILAPESVTRNLYIHGVWYRIDGTFKIFVEDYTKIKGSRGRKQDVTVQDLKEHANKIRNTTKELINLINEIDSIKPK